MCQLMRVKEFRLRWREAGRRTIFIVLVHIEAHFKVISFSAAQPLEIYLMQI